MNFEKNVEGISHAEGADVEAHAPRGFLHRLAFAAVVFFSTGCVLTVFFGTLLFSGNGPLVIRILIFLAAVGGVAVSLKIGFQLYKSLCAVRIEGKLLTGKTYFGKPFEYDLTEVASVKRTNEGLNVRFQMRDGSRFAIHGDIDFFPVLIDAIEARAANLDAKSREVLAKLRTRAQTWFSTGKAVEEGRYQEGMPEKMIQLAKENGTWREEQK